MTQRFAVTLTLDFPDDEYLHSDDVEFEVEAWLKSVDPAPPGKALKGVLALSVDTDEE